MLGMLAVGSSTTHGFHQNDRNILTNVCSRKRPESSDLLRKKDVGLLIIFFLMTLAAESGQRVWSGTVWHVSRDDSTVPQIKLHNMHWTVV